MTIKQEDRTADAGRRESLMAAGGVLGALAASSCCVPPLVLVSLGVSGTWIGSLSIMAPYQPFFIGATIALLGYGYYLVYWRAKQACAPGEACARPVPSRLTKLTLWIATVLVLVAASFNYVVPFLLRA
jgi:mercuric ion transport protein